MTNSWRLFLSGHALAFVVLGVIFIAAISVGAFLFVDARVEAILNARQAAVVDSEIRLMQLIDREEGRAALVRLITRRTNLPDDDLAIHALVDAEGRYRAGDVDWPERIVADGSWQPIFTYGRQHGTEISGFGRAITLPDGAKVLVGRDQTARRSVEAALVEAMTIALLVLFSVALGLAIFLNRLVLDRIDAIAGTARRIIAGSLHERIPMLNQGGELNRLSGVLNEMLDANQTHIDQMRMVTDAIAHDLRLPLQRVKADLERAQASSDAEERQTAFAAADSEIDGALATFNALLDITRAEAGVGTENFDAVALGDLVRDVVELFEPVAEDKRQTLRADISPVTLRGQGTLLRQALGNLIQNAIKFAPEGSAIDVSLTHDDASARISVADRGPGIPESERETALRPFGRLARDKASDGKGLGLSMVAACAKLHGGHLILESAEPGLRAIVALPLRPA